MADTNRMAPSHNEATQQTSYAEDTSALYPCHLGDDSPIKHATKWVKLQNIIRQHVVTLQDEDDVEWSVIVRDEGQVVRDIIGNADLVDVMKCHGINIGQRLSFDDATVPDGLQKRVIPMFAVGTVPIGSVCVVADEALDGRWLATITKSIAYAAERQFDADFALRDNAMMYQALLSHLDYHIVRLMDDGKTKAYHPIPLQDEVRNEIHQFANDNPDGTYELTIGERLYSAVLCTWAYPDGSPAGKVGMFRDITQERQMEWRMRNADRVNVLASLAAGIAHEIRNPLTTAKGFLQLFRERQVGLTEQRYIDLTIQELDRIQQLVKDFMSLARPDQPRFQHVELNQIIDEVIDFMRPEAMLQGVSLTMHCQDSPLYIKGDPNQIKQVLMNVLQNALQACNQKGEVTIQTNRRSSSAVIAVEDTGVGLSHEQLSRVFQPFFTTKESGTGLGLAICRQIMNEHGGSIQIHSEVGVGTRVTLQLPVATGEEPSKSP